MHYIHRLQQKSLQDATWSVQIMQQMRFPLRFLWAELSHTQLFLIGEMFQSLAFLCGPSWTLYSLSISLPCWWSQMDTVLQVWPHHAEQGATITWQVCKEHKALRNSVWFICFQSHKISCPASSSELEDSRSHLDRKSYLPALYGCLDACMVVNNMFKQLNLIPTIWFHGGFFHFIPGLFHLLQKKF